MSVLADPFPPHKVNNNCFRNDFLTDVVIIIDQLLKELDLKLEDVRKHFLLSQAYYYYNGNPL